MSHLTVAEVTPLLCDNMGRLELVQATEGTVRVTVESFAARLGSSNFRNIRSPGWLEMLSRVNNDITRVHRGHLVPNILGVSGQTLQSLPGMFTILLQQYCYQGCSHPW